MTDWLVVEELAPSTRGALAPLYEAAAAGSLVMPFCRACGQVLELEQAVCDKCGCGDPTWRPVERAGVVHAVTTVHRHEPALLRSTEPYHVVDVELTSGHRVIMTTSRPVDAAPVIGDAVQVTFRRVGTVAIPAVAVSPDERELV
ncbi:MAG: Zn-ribbon domain-containing OB-fold protein [Acidimicrobiales bacterium]